MTENTVKFAGLYKVDNSTLWNNVSNGAIGFGKWKDVSLGTAKKIYANGIEYNVADASKLYDVSKYVDGLKITLTGGVIDTSFKATIESGDSYVVIGKSTKTGAADGSIAISLKTCNVSVATEDASGVATAYNVQQYVKEQIGTLSQALVFKGEVSSYNDLTGKQTNGKTGDTYVVTTAWSAADGHGAADAGDMFILEVTSETEKTYTWHQVERNLDGAVTAADALEADCVVLGGGEQKVKKSSVKVGTDASSAAAASTLATEKWVEGAVNTAAKSLTVSTSDNSVYINLVDGSTTPQTLGSVEVKKDSYVTVAAESTADKKGSITIGLTTCNVSDATEDESGVAKNDGVATALDVKKYIASQLEWTVLS